MANPNTPVALATLISQLAFVGTRVQNTNRIYVNAVDQMLSDIANAAGTTGGSPVTPAMLVMTGKSSYDPDSASTYGGSTGIAVQFLDLWEQQNTTYDVMWSRLETDLQTAINNIMGNQQLAQNGSSHATAVRSVGLDEYSHKQFIQLGATYFVYRQTGFSIDALPFDAP
jgi:hypothetical protein